MSFVVNQQQFQMVVRFVGSLRSANSGAAKGVTAAGSESAGIRVAAAAEAQRVFTAAGCESDIVHHNFAFEGRIFVLSARLKQLAAIGNAPSSRLLVEVEKAMPGLTARTVLRRRRQDSAKQARAPEQVARSMQRSSGAAVSRKTGLGG